MVGYSAYSQEYGADYGTITNFLGVQVLSSPEDSIEKNMYALEGLYGRGV